ncbi:MAG: hypothetical protein IKG21_00610 [Atopobiaceae bacterium]|nr:hypothetical protein [Atopobiaceae bacterium]
MLTSAAIIPLAGPLREGTSIGRQHVERTLADLICKRGGTAVDDVAGLVRHKAIPFEDNRMCRTFLSVDEADLIVGVPTVLEYFTLQYIHSRANDESPKLLGDDFRAMKTKVCPAEMNMTLLKAPNV